MTEYKGRRREKQIIDYMRYYIVKSIDAPTHQAKKKMKLRIKKC
jgi:hypothetical protein